MPWCEECSKYMVPSAMEADGTCPTCHRPLDVPQPAASDTITDEKAPWHFKLMVVALVVYLVWRFAEIFV